MMSHHIIFIKWSLILWNILQYLVSVETLAPDDSYIDRTETSCCSIYIAFLVIGFGSVMTGALATSYFKHVKSGTWWVGVVVWICPIVSLSLLRYRRFYFSLLLAIGTAAVALLGAVLDARSRLHFSSITACATKGYVYPYKDVLYSGKSSDYLVAQSCYNSTQFIESNGCYCVSNNNLRSCTEYVRYGDLKFTTSDTDKSVTYNTCYDTVERFTGVVTASFVFCCLSLFVALLQILYISLSRWKCRPGVPTRGHQLNGWETEVWHFFDDLFTLFNIWFT